jgi:nitroimidazol reductase NimA-like FMN-containing flavoprotein (pyridoxamine 5'-phosphate oxidase superfamily)
MQNDRTALDSVRRRNSKPALSKDQNAGNARISDLIGSKDLCRISTIRPNGWSHLVPVSYVHLDETFYVPAEKDSKKVRNLRRDPKATILIDIEEVESRVMRECQATILQNDIGKNLRYFMQDQKG